MVICYEPLALNMHGNFNISYVMITDDNVMSGQLFGAFWFGQSCIREREPKAVGLK